LDTLTLQEELEYYTGTENYYQHILGINYTDGVRFLVNNTESHWLIDLITSYQAIKEIRQLDFQVYKLIVNKDKTAQIEVSDGNYNVIRTEEISYTDFPLDEITLWYTGGVIVLPSEY